VCVSVEVTPRPSLLHCLLPHCLALSPRPSQHTQSSPYSLALSTLLHSLVSCSVYSLALCCSVFQYLAVCCSVWVFVEVTPRSIPRPSPTRTFSYSHTTPHPPCHMQLPRTTHECCIYIYLCGICMYIHTMMYIWVYCL